MEGAMEKHQYPAEKLRLMESHPESMIFPWYKWGPYLSERSWGTVREDYSPTGQAWDYFPYNLAKSKAYKWGEDGIGGICDRFQIMALSFAFWNGQDKELKERLFGVIPQQANHGEDVKEVYYYLDNTPSHSYMKFLYKYPHAPFPYEQLVTTNQQRNKNEKEFELIDTGVFKEDKYFDIFIEYGKAQPEDICIKVHVINRASYEARIDILPQIVFRNHPYKLPPEYKTPQIHLEKSAECVHLVCDDFNQHALPQVPFEYYLGPRFFSGSLEAEALFTNNVTACEEAKHAKDAFHKFIVEKQNVINPENKGTKAGLYYREIKIPAFGHKTLYFRLSNKKLKNPLQDVEAIIRQRKEEADVFYASLHPALATEDEKNIQRQALAGLLWSKQFYYFDVSKWVHDSMLDQKSSLQRAEVRNKHWKHLMSMRILLMPDKWEYPWFAAWDLAFHAVSISLIDMNFAKEQLWLLLFDQFQHPNGQIPAYEWEFSDMNPPVQAWAILKVFEQDHKNTGKKDYDFLKKCFHKLMINFTWWVNKVDSKGNNVFEGGFLGLDNITVFDRSVPIPGGGTLEQSDGTGWMGMFCLTLMRISLELASEDPVYESTATKFFEHYVYIASALHSKKERGCPIWNEAEGFFYDVLSLPTGESHPIMVRSLVGIIPLYGIECVTAEELNAFPVFKQNFLWFFKNRQDIASSCITKIDALGKEKYLLSLMNLHQMKKVLAKVWDPGEFRSEYGLRSLSKIYQDKPYQFLGGSIGYEPGESISYLKGGNSNWRGPIWFPTTFLLIDALKKIDLFLDQTFFIEYEDKKIYPKQMAKYFALALIKIFKKDSSGKRPVFADDELMQNNPYWQDYLLFYEHFHADTGRGLGANHQTGWTALVANLIHEWIE